MEVKPQKASFSYSSSSLSKEDAALLRIYFSEKSLLMGFFTEENGIISMEEFSLSGSNAELLAVQLIRDFKETANQISSTHLFLGSAGVSAIPKNKYVQSEKRLILESIFPMDSDTEVLGTEIGDKEFLFSCHREILNEAKPVSSDEGNFIATFASNAKFSSKEPEGGYHLNCFIHHESMDVWLYHDKKLLLFNRFNCEMVADFAYHILNCGQQMGWSAKKDLLTISGFESRMSEIAHLLKGYIQYIRSDYMKNAPEVERLALLGL